MLPCATNHSVPSPQRAQPNRPAASSRGLLLLVVPALLLSGCHVGPAYHVPITAAATAPSYKETDPAWTTAAPADAIPRGDWWTLFADPGLNALEPQVAAANQNLAIADANLRAARAAIAVQHAALYPQLGTSPFVGGVRDSANQPYFNAANANNGVANLLLPLQLSYEVDLWGSIHRSITASKEEYQATAADRQTALLSLQAELAIDYFELRAADAQQKLLNQTVAQYQDAVRITNNRFVGGIAVKSDLTQAQTQLEDARVAASDVAVARAQFEHAIANLLGRAPASFSLAPAPLPLSVTPPIVPPGLPSQLLQRRPDIAAAERRTAEANQQIGIAQAAFYPNLSLSAGVGLQSTALTSLFNTSSIVYSLGPTLAQTLFDAGRRRGLSDEAVAQYDRQAATYRQSVLDALQQVEDNLSGLRVLATEQQQQQRATAAAEESERIFDNRYVGGVDTYLQVITAQTSALNNQRNDIDILRRRMDATVLLIKNLGGGWDASQLPKP